MEDLTPEKPAKDEKNGLLAWIKNLLPTKINSDDSLREAIEELIEEKEAPPQSSVALHERRLISNILQLPLGHETGQDRPGVAFPSGRRQTLNNIVLLGGDETPHHNIQHDRRAI